MKFLRYLSKRSRVQIAQQDSWTLHKLLISISDELTPLKPILSESTMTFAEHEGISIKFIRNQFSRYDTVEINGSILVRVGTEERFITDLFTLSKLYYGEKFRPLGIHRHAIWKDSQFQKQVQEFVLPYLQDLLTTTTDTLTAQQAEEIVSALRAKQTK